MRRFSQGGWAGSIATFSLLGAVSAVKMAHGWGVGRLASLSGSLLDSHRVDKQPRHRRRISPSCDVN